MHYLILFLCFIFQTTNCALEAWPADPEYCKMIPSKENPHKATVRVHPDALDRYLSAAFERIKDPTHSQVVTIGASSYFNENTKPVIHHSIRRICRIETFGRSPEEKQHVQALMAAFEQKIHTPETSKEAPLPPEEKGEADSVFIAPPAQPHKPKQKKQRKRKTLEGTVLLPESKSSRTDDQKTVEDTALEALQQATAPAVCRARIPFVCYEEDCNKAFGTYVELLCHCSSVHKATKLAQPLECFCRGRKNPRRVSYNSLAHNGRCDEINKALDAKNERDQKTKRKKQLEGLKPPKE